MQKDRKTYFKYAVLTLPLATHFLFPVCNSNIPRVQYRGITLTAVQLTK